MWKCALLIGILASAGLSQDISGDLPYVSVDIRTPPVAVQTDGGYLLAYEVFVTNWYDKNITIRGVQILVGDSSPASLEGESLDRAFSYLNPQKGLLLPRQSTMLVLSGVIDEVPAFLDHRIRFRVEGEPRDTEIRYPATPVRRNSLRIHPPLRGDSWVATNGPGANNHHTAGVMQFEGRVRVPQRFAIDFVRIYEDREMFHGDRKDVHNYRCYGAEVLAVANARVVAVRDGIPENPGQAKSNALPDTLDNLGGNRVILDLGDGYFAGYMHLQPRSIRVKEGDRVQTGDVLGLVGNSGSPYPHLHFQVTDGPWPFTSDGMPYVFDSFVRDSMGVRDEIPLDGRVLTFDDGPKQK